MSTPLDIVTGALRAVGAVAGGETPTPEEANDAFNLLNDLLDQLSNEQGMLFCKQEVIHEITPNQTTYTIGPGGNVGATISGAITAGLNLLSVTGISAGALAIGQTLNGTVLASAGQVNAVSVTGQGFGYTSNPTLAISGGGGAGATATSTLTCIGIPGVFGGGAGYTAGDVLTLQGGVFTRPCTFRIMAVGFGYQVIDGGAYTVLPGTVGTFDGTNVTGVGGTCTVTGGSGAGLKPFCAWGLGAPVLTGAGAGYFVPPTVTPTGGNPTTPGTLAATITAFPLGSVAPGTVITSFGSGLGGNGVSALGTYYLNLNQTVSGGPVTLTTSSPRPLRINSGFVRINSTGGTLDFPIEVSNVENFERIGLKQMPGPWPRALYYQPSEPLGILTYFPNPSQGEVHLFCDMLFPRFQTLQDTITLPQGYAMGLRWMLAEILMVEYPATAGAQEIRAMIPQFAQQARALIKRTNMQPPQQVTFDPILMSGRVNDAGWILHGGFQT